VDGERSGSGSVGGAPDTADMPDAPDAPDAPDESARIAHALDRLYTRLGRQYGPLSRPLRRALRLLAGREERGEASRVGDLAAGLELTTAGATRLLDRLEELGYAERYRAPGQDQRQVAVRLTPAGRDALVEADAAFVARARATLAPLTAAERSRLAALLERLA
jgi:DNA-binding MarR family transcriptional regulator